jgi:hypothetical protein
MRTLQIKLGIIIIIKDLFPLIIPIKITYAFLNFDLCTIRFAHLCTLETNILEI